MSILRRLHRNFHFPPFNHTLAARFLSTPAAAEYDDGIRTAALVGDFDAVRRLLTERVKENCANTTNTFSFIGGSSPPELLDQISQTLPLIDNRAARKAAYDSLIARLCKLQRVTESLSLVDAMARADCGMKPSTFHPILDALAKKRMIEDAWPVIESMRGYGVSPDQTAYNYMVSGCCSAGDLAEAARVLAVMREAGMGGDPYTYDSLVMATCKAGRVGGAIMLLRRMEDDGVLVLYSTHAHVIGTMVRLGYYAQAVEYAMIYAGRDRRVDTENFGLLAQRLIKKKRYREADLVLTEMKRRELPIKDHWNDHLANSKLTTEN